MTAFAFRDRVLGDSLDAALQDLLALEEASRGEPKHFAYETALDALLLLRSDLDNQLAVAARNSYYRHATKQLSHHSGIVA
jgi:hypothetical protein